jgi:hypothetical protein
MRFFGFINRTQRGVIVQKSISLALLMVFGLGGAAQAQEIKGDLTLGHSFFTDENQISKTYAEGALEFGVTPKASVQLDLGVYSLGLVNDTATNLVVHGIYDVHATGSVGAFVGMDRLAGSDATFYGIEYGQSLGAGSIEAYAGTGDEAGVDGTVIGVESEFLIGADFGVGVKLDHADFEGTLSATRFGVKGLYGIGDAGKVFAELGTLRGEIDGASASEPFVGLGLTVNLGQDESTFGRRGLFNLFPGL